MLYVINFMLHCRRYSQFIYMDMEHHLNIFNPFKIEKDYFSECPSLFD